MPAAKALAMPRAGAAIAGAAACVAGVATSHHAPGRPAASATHRLARQITGVHHLGDRHEPHVRLRIARRLRRFAWLGRERPAALRGDGTLASQGGTEWVQPDPGSGPVHHGCERTELGAPRRARRARRDPLLRVRPARSRAVSIRPDAVRIESETPARGRRQTPGGTMRRVIVTNNVTLDGVMQAPGRPDEDLRVVETGGLSDSGPLSPLDPTPGRRTRT